MGWTDNFLDTPPRDIGPTKQAPRSGPAKKLRKEVVLAIQGLAYLGSRPCVTPIYTGQLVIDGQRYTLGRPGASDLHCCWFGHSFHIELKAGSDTQRGTQVKYQERVKEAGGTYLLIHSARECLDAMMTWHKMFHVKQSSK